METDPDPTAINHVPSATDHSAHSATGQDPSLTAHSDPAHLKADLVLSATALVHLAIGQDLTATDHNVHSVIDPVPMETDHSALLATDQDLTATDPDDLLETGTQSLPSAIALSNPAPSMTGHEEHSATARNLSATGQDLTATDHNALSATDHVPMVIDRSGRAHTATGHNAPSATDPSGQDIHHPAPSATDHNALSATDQDLHSAKGQGRLTVTALSDQDALTRQDRDNSATARNAPSETVQDLLETGLVPSATDRDRHSATGLSAQEMTDLVLTETGQDALSATDHSVHSATGHRATDDEKEMKSKFKPSYYFFG